MKRKGISDVIATVLLILITLAAVVVLIQFVVPFVKNNLSSTTECRDYQQHFTFEAVKGSNCIKVDEQNILLLSIRAQSSEKNTSIDEVGNEVNGFELRLRDKSGSVKIIKVPGDLGISRYPNGELKIPNSGDLYTYNISNSLNMEYVEIRTTLKSGKTCELADSMRVEICR